MLSNTQKIIDYFTNLDAKRGNIVRDTSKGIFGVSDIKIMNTFFEKINLIDAKHIVDLGSGDGRISILANAFTTSTGIEIDKLLVEESEEHANILEEGMSRKTNFECSDYEEFDYSKVDVIFSFADHFFTKTFIEKLKKEFCGIFYVYQGVFLPEGIKKGRTIWINNVEGKNPIPIISYEF